MRNRRQPGQYGFTLRFKYLINDFQTWKNLLEKYDLFIDKLQEESLFEKIWMKASNLFLKWNTPEKALINIVMKLETHFTIYKRDKSFFDKELEQLTKAHQEIKNKQYLVNRVQTEIEDDYLSSSNTSEVSNSIPQIQLLKEIEQFNKRELPINKFINNFIKSITLDIQPLYDFNTEGEYYE